MRVIWISAVITISWLAAFIYAKDLPVEACWVWVIGCLGGFFAGFFGDE